MRALRVFLALLLAAGPIHAQPVVDLLSRYVVPADEIAASAPEGDSPQGSGKRLAVLESDLALISESLEGFSHPQDADKAILAAKPRLPAGTVPYFKDRAMALDALYRTLAVVDYTWALRFPDPPCSPGAKRSTLLRSDDGLFMDPFSGKTSAWMTSLLGPSAKGKDLESALDHASASVALGQAEYARLRARQNLITRALAATNAGGEERAELYCKRAEMRVKLAAANRVSGTVLASRSSEETVSRQGVVIIAGKTTEGLEARGAGVVVDTKSGIRVLTDRRLGTGDVVALFDGNTAPVSMSIEREDEKSGLLLLRPEGDLGEPLILAQAAPKTDDLTFALAHSERLGAWTKTYGLVTSASSDQFQTDAVADASMAGGAVLDEEGHLAGLLLLRRVEGSRIDWPAGVPAPALRAWLDGGVAPEASPVALADSGTTKILTESRSLLQSVAVGAGAITAGYGFDTKTQWGSVHATCMANCSDNGPNSSYSDNGSAELGQALGKLMAIGAEALIFKGIPALFRGIGSLFKSKPRHAVTADPVRPDAPGTRLRAQSTTTNDAPVKVREVKVEPPPKRECTFEPAKLPKTIGAERVEFMVHFSCKELAGGPTIELGGHKVIVSVGWKGLKASTYSITTDANGYASLSIKVQSVEIASKKAHDELDNYDPDRARGPTGPEVEDSSADGVPDSKVLINAANPTDVAPVVKVVADLSVSAPQTVATLVQDEAVPATTAVIGAKILLGPAASTVFMAVAIIGTFEVGLQIGGGANEVINNFDYKRRHPSEYAKTGQYENKFDELDAHESEVLAPPGRCAKLRWKALDVDAGRKCAQPRSCRDVMPSDCVELRLRLHRNEECAAARKLLMDECFDGGDAIHKKELGKVIGVLADCTKRINDECQ